jgi:hypothetical protein
MIVVLLFGSRQESGTSTKVRIGMLKASQNRTEQNACCVDVGVGGPC